MGGLPVKPKLQGYVAQELFDEFERFRATHNLNQSKGLEKLLAEFFNGSIASTVPHDEVVAAASLLAAMRAELADLRQELVQRLEVVESRLAIESALPLDGLADESAAPMISLSDESVTGFSGLVAESASNSVDIQSGSAYESAIPLDESAVVEDAITLPANVSAISSADESAGEPPEEETVVVEEPAAGEPEEEEVVVEEAIAKPHRKN